MKKKRFVQAFSVAMSTYIGSTSLREDVNNEIGVLLEGQLEMDEILCKELADIIKNHRLRMHFVPDLPACLTTKLLFYRD